LGTVEQIGVERGELAVVWSAGSWWCGGGWSGGGEEGVPFGSFSL